jgi:hypothetical protein
MKYKAIAAMVAGTIAALGVSAGQTASVKTCTEPDEPKSGWTTTGSQKGSCNSSHELQEETVSNPGGNQPRGQQP